MSDGTIPEPPLTSDTTCIHDMAELQDDLQRFQTLDSAYLAPLRPLIGDAAHHEITTTLGHITHLLASSRSGAPAGQESLRLVRSARRLGSILQRVVSSMPDVDPGSPAAELAFERVESIAAAVESIGGWPVCVAVLQPPQPKKPPTCFVGVLWRRGNWGGKITPERQRSNLVNNAENAGITGEIVEYAIPGGYNLLTVGCKLASFTVVDTSGGKRTAYVATFTVPAGYVFDGTYRGGNVGVPQNTPKEGAESVDVEIKVAP